MENTHIGNWEDVSGVLRLSPDCAINLDRHELLQEGKKPERIALQMIQLLQIMLYLRGETISSLDIYWELWCIGKKPRDKNADGIYNNNLFADKRGDVIKLVSRTNGILNKARKRTKKASNRINNVNRVGYYMDVKGLDLSLVSIPREEARPDETHAEAEMKTGAYARSAAYSGKSEQREAGFRGGTVREVSREGVDSSLRLDLPKQLTKMIVSFSNEHTVIHRESEIERLEMRLREGKNIVLLNGFGGVGKTSLARVLYHKVRDNYDGYGWVPYQNDLQTSLLSSLNIYNEMEDQKSRWSAISRLFRLNTGKKILFIDNVDKDESLGQDPLKDKTLNEIAEWPNLTLVLTSRLEEICGFGYESWPVGYLDFDDCVDLFYYYYSPVEYHKQMDNRQSLRAVRSLVELADCHTYAIELLAKGAKREGPLEKYLEKVRGMGFSFPSRTVYTEHSGSSAIVAQQLRILFDMNSRTDKARKVLWNFSIMPNVELSTERCEEWLDCSKEDVEELVNEGWLLYRQGYTMHPLIREVVHFDLIDGKAPDGTGQRILQKLRDHSFFDPHDDPAAVGMKLDVADSVMRFAVIPDEHDRADTAFHLAEQLRKWGRPAPAIAYYRNAMSLYETLCFSDESLYSSDVAKVYTTLGYQLSYTNSGRREAEQLLRKALEKWKSLAETQPGRFRAEIATTCDYLGYLLIETDDGRKEAEDLLRSALGIRRQLSEDDPKTSERFVAWTCDNLGYLLAWKRESRDEAEELLKEALTIRETLERESPWRYASEVSWTCGNLAFLLQFEKERMKEAENYYREALSIRLKQEERYPDVYRGDVAIMSNNLANLLRDDPAKKQEAEKLYRRALEINRALEEENRGVYLAEVALSCNNLATLLQIDAGAASEVSDLYYDELEIFSNLEREHTGMYEADVANAYYNMGLFKLFATDNTGSALDELKQAVLFWQKSDIEHEKQEMIHKLTERVLSENDPALTDNRREEWISLQQWVGIYAQSGERKRLYTPCLDVC